MYSLCRPNWSDSPSIKFQFVDSSPATVLMCEWMYFFANPVLGPTCSYKVNFSASVSASACNSLIEVGNHWVCVCLLAVNFQLCCTTAEKIV